MELLEGDMIFFFFLFSACSAYEVSYLKTNLLKFLRNLRKPNLLVYKQRGLKYVAFPLTLRSLGGSELQYAGSSADHFKANPAILVLLFLK